MKIYGNDVTAGGGFGGDHTTPLPHLVFREKPPTPVSPTALRFPSDIPGDKVVYDPRGSRPYRQGVKLRPRSSTWSNPTAISQEKVDTIVRLYEGGMTMHDIAAKLGCARATVRKYLDDNGVAIRPARRKDIDLGAVRLRLELGESLRSIAIDIGVSASTLIARLRE